MGWNFTVADFGRWSIEWQHLIASESWLARVRDKMMRHGRDCERINLFEPNNL
jgi:hypothetical protein